MLRILRAFAWLRWRMLVNALERTGTRDTLERLSLAVEQLGPLIAAALLIPSLLGLSALSGYAGYALATAAAPPLTFEILRYLALAAMGLAVLGPVLMPAMERTQAVRLLLLPIPRPLLYATQVAGALADPWIILTLPVVIALPVGLAAGGALGAGLLALAAGLLFVVVLIGLTALSASVVQLVVRDRRRGEIVGLVFVIVLPILGMLPGLLDRDGGDSGQLFPGWLSAAASQLGALVPAEQFISTVRSAVATGPWAAAPGLIVLLLTGLIAHGLGVAAFVRLLATPESSGSRRSGGAATTWGRRVLWLSPSASAVALAQLRLTLRTSRGRATLLSPLVAFAVFAVLLTRGGSESGLGQFLGSGGLGLATFGGFICLMAILPLAMNQFAIDGAGLTLELLSPIDDWDLLVGKAVAGGLAAAAPSLTCVLLAWVIFRDGSPALWLSLPLGLCATYLLAAPVAAFASAMFPRVVDLNSIGRGSNAHGAAGLIGLVTFVVSGLPALGLALLAAQGLGRPHLAPVFLLVWCGVAFLVCRLLLIPVRSFVTRRRENLSFVAG